MVPWPSGWESLGCFVAKDNFELVVFLRDYFLPWVFFGLSGLNGKLGRNSGFSDVDIVGRVQQFVGLFLLFRWKITGISGYPSLKLACSPVDDGIVCREEGHSEEHGIFSKIYDEEWVCVGLPLVMNLEICNLGDFSYAVLGSVYITDSSGIGEILGWNGEIFDYVWRNEVFGCATVN